MSYHCRIVFSLLCVFNVSLAVESVSQHSDRDGNIKVVPSDRDVVAEIMNNATNNQQQGQNSQSIKQKHTFSKIEIEEMKMVFEYSPLEAKEILKHLQDPTYFPNNEDYRSVMFVGEPGTGKTTMAKALAYYMAAQGWDYKIVSSASFLGEYRNQTAINLTKELEMIQASGRPTILIVDELNKVLENSNSKHHDTDATSAALWTFLDKQAANEKFFFIGTMNRIDKLPKPFKDRVFLDCIEFTAIQDNTIKNTILRRYLTTQTIQIDKQVTDEFLNKQLQKIGPCTGRNLKKVSSIICRINKRNEVTDSPVMVIKKQSIEQAFAEYVSLKEKIQYDLEEETEEERQNRFQKENSERQEMQFIQQQLIQAGVLSSDSSPAEKRVVVGRYFTDEQRQLYKRMMANTWAREEYDAQVNAAQKAEQIAAKLKAEEEYKASREGKWSWQS